MIMIITLALSLFTTDFTWLSPAASVPSGTSGWQVQAISLPQIVGMLCSIIYKAYVQVIWCELLVFLSTFFFANIGSPSGWMAAMPCSWKVCQSWDPLGDSPMESHIHHIHMVQRWPSSMVAAVAELFLCPKMCQE